MSIQENSSASSFPSATDPICGMEVDTASARWQTEYQGQAYYFCCKHCLEKFRSDPPWFAIAADAMAADFE